MLVVQKFDRRKYQSYGLWLCAEFFFCPNKCRNDLRASWTIPDAVLRTETIEGREV
jgi:hypothetical protein